MHGSTTQLTPDGHLTTFGGAADSIRVSVIVRSTHRPSLVAALESIAAQDYPALQVIVVGASGPDHPVPADHAGQHPVRFVASASPLSRPLAANVGMDAAEGDWISFLDDDDVLLPGHISGLVAAQRNAKHALFVYTLAVARMAGGRNESWGQPFALRQLYERNFIHLAAALFSRELPARGCRFDQTFEIMEDWDFFLQCAQHTVFHFEPKQTFEWRADSGSSGAGGGANHDDVRFARFRDRIYMKWAQSRDALIDRVGAALQDAVAGARSGEHDRAEADCRAILTYSANDPDVLNFLALVQRSAGRCGEARETQELACSVRPGDPALIYNLAVLCRMQGDLDRARAHCQRAMQARPRFAPARKLLAELQGAARTESQ